jgi:hypothetical protein
LILIKVCLTMALPRRPPVAGTPIFERGEHTGAMPARLVRADVNRRGAAGGVTGALLISDGRVRDNAPILGIKGRIGSD